MQVLAGIGGFLAGMIARACGGRCDDQRDVTSPPLLSNRQNKMPAYQGYGGLAEPVEL